MLSILHCLSAHGPKQKKKKLEIVESGLVISSLVAKSKCRKSITILTIFICRVIILYFYFLISSFQKTRVVIGEQTTDNKSSHRCRKQQKKAMRNPNQSESSGIISKCSTSASLRRSSSLIRFSICWSFISLINLEQL